MFQDPETRLLAALVQAAAARHGTDHAVVRAGKVGAAAVRSALDALPDDERAGLFATAHRLMREDIDAIRSFLPGGGPGRDVH